MLLLIVSIERYSTITMLCVNNNGHGLVDVDDDHVLGKRLHVPTIAKISLLLHFFNRGLKRRYYSAPSDIN